MLHGRKGGLAVLLTAVLTVGCLSSVAQAAIGGGDLAFPTPAVPGETAVGVQVTHADVEALSYEVPLYLTLAVVDDGSGGAQVVTPRLGAYYIQNTSPNGTDGKEAALAVTEVTVSTVTGGTWSLETAPAANKDLSLTIGGLQLPALAAGATTSPTVRTADEPDSAFYTAAGGYVTLTGGKRRLPLSVSGQAVATPGEVGAAAQFRLSYTVSLLDDDGDPIGSFVNP